VYYNGVVVLHPLQVQLMQADGRGKRLPGRLRKKGFRMGCMDGMGWMEGWMDFRTIVDFVTFGLRMGILG